VPWGCGRRDPARWSRRPRPCPCRGRRPLRCRRRSPPSSSAPNRARCLPASRHRRSDRLSRRPRPRSGVARRSRPLLPAGPAPPSSTPVVAGDAGTATGAVVAVTAVAGATTAAGAGGAATAGARPGPRPRRPRLRRPRRRRRPPHRPSRAMRPRTRVAGRPSPTRRRTPRPPADPVASDRAAPADQQLRALEVATGGGTRRHPRALGTLGEELAAWEPGGAGHGVRRLNPLPPRRGPRPSGVDVRIRPAGRDRPVCPHAMIAGRPGRG